MTEPRCSCWKPSDPHQLDCEVRRAEERAASIWTAALADPKFLAALDEGLADLKAGRVAPFDDAPAENPA